MTLPPLLSRAAALGLLAASIWFAVALIALPWVAAYQRNDAAITESLRLTAFFQRIAQSRGALEAQLDEAVSRQASSSRYLPGETDALAAAGLQELVGAVIEGNDGTVSAIQTLPVADEGALRRVAVRVQFQATTEGLFRSVYAIESSRPFIFVDNVDIRDRTRRTRSRRDRNGRTVLTDAAVATELVVRLDLFGFVEPGS